MDLTRNWIIQTKFDELDRIFERLPEEAKRVFEQEWEPIHKEVQRKFLPWYLAVFAIDSVAFGTFFQSIQGSYFWSSIENIEIFLALILLVCIAPLELIREWKLRVLLEKKRGLLIGIYHHYYD